MSYTANQIFEYMRDFQPIVLDSLGDDVELDDLDYDEYCQMFYHALCESEQQEENVLEDVSYEVLRDAIILMLFEDFKPEVDALIACRYNLYGIEYPDMDEYHARTPYLYE